MLTSILIKLENNQTPTLSMDPHLLLFFSSAFLIFHVVQSTKVTFTNNCPYTVWPATMSVGKAEQLKETGFELTSKSTHSLDVPAPWTTHFWARTRCTTGPSGKFICRTGDCGTGQLACNGEGGIQPITYAELDTKGRMDFYGVHTVNGFNVPVSMAPQGGSGPCEVSSCSANINSDCPSKLAMKGPDGSVIACKSACQEFNKPEYCCVGQYKGPGKCPDTEYTKFFKNKCPKAFASPADELAFACSRGANYAIKFCP